MTLAYLTTPLVGVVNLGAVGQLGHPAMVGGVAIGALIFDIAFLSFGFLRAGTTGLVAQAYGAGDDRAVAATLYRAVILALGIGVVLLLLERPISWRRWRSSAAATRSRPRPMNTGGFACFRRRWRW
jgi:MATE family multidrug resistance protein